MCLIQCSTVFQFYGEYERIERCQAFALPGTMSRACVCHDSFRCGPFPGALVPVRLLEEPGSEVVRFSDMDVFLVIAEDLAGREVLRGSVFDIVPRFW